jgi:asparagine synthase (glutamine-hydrolysing)
MTAIYGLWNFEGDDAADNFRRMDSALSRYGSDAHDVFHVESGVILGRHLHRSLPEDCLNGKSRDGQRYVVVADVRLTERDDLANQLALGHGALQMSDAAIAAAAIERWNEDAFDRIYGAFAIAAWDKQERRILLARDHLGLKPLFYHRGERFFAFASMPEGLHALPDVPRGPDLESMKRFLATEWQSPGRTHYEKIWRIMPGSYAVVTPAGVSESRYWKPDLTPLKLASNDHYAAELSNRLEHAVEATLRGVESLVGAHLSSGFDSTAVATTAARQLASRGGKVVAYTAAPREGFEKTIPNRIADESELARATAAMHSNMEHVVVRSDRAPTANLSRTASAYGAPVFNICNEGWYDAINDDAAKRGITVMLEGAMGNATISETGILALPDLLRRGRFFSWLRLVIVARRKGTVSLPRALWNSFVPFLPNELYRWLIDRRHGALASAQRNSSLKREHLHQVTIETAAESEIPGSTDRILSSGWVRPTHNSLLDRLTLLSGDESGPASKGMLAEWKIDYRDPTVDRRLVEFSLRVPVEQLIHEGEPRALLRKVLSDRAPREMLDNRFRGYQAADWHEWLDGARDELAEEIQAMEMFEPAAELIDVERLKELIENWPEPGSDRWMTYDGLIDYRICLLRAVSASRFMRQASRSNY